MDELAAAVLRVFPDFDAARAGPFRLDGARVRGVVARWASSSMTDAPLDEAWAEMETALVPRWRTRGRGMLAGQLGMLTQEAAEGSKDGATSGVGRGLRRIFRRWASQGGKPAKVVRLDAGGGLSRVVPHGEGGR
jgi:hypothetical protein